MRKYVLTISPFLASIYFVLFAFNYNTQQVVLSQLWRPMIFALSPPLLFISVALLCWRELNKAVFASWIFVILFWNYDIINGFLGNLDFIHLTDRRILPLVIFIYVYVCIFSFDFLKKKNFAIKKINTFACFVTLILVAFNGVQIFASEVRTTNSASSDKIPIMAHENSVKRTSRDLPNIYFFVFDEAADFYTMETIFNFDTSRFRDFLYENSLHVVQESRTMYFRTRLAIPSLFNLGYVTSCISHKEFYEIAISESWDDIQELIDPIEALNNSRLVELLRSHGYKTIAYTRPSIWANYDNFDDVRFPSDATVGVVILNFFEGFLIERTMLNPFSFMFNMIDNVVTHPNLQIYNEILYIIDRITNFTPEENQPAFLYAHLLLPHTPFVFEVDGSFRPYGHFYWRNYIPQYEFMISQIKKIVKNILFNDPNAIIIIQSDHGPRERFGGFPGIDIPYTHMFRVLNLLRFPESYEYPVGRLSPLNTIKFVLNTFLGENFDIVEEAFYE